MRATATGLFFEMSVNEESTASRQFVASCTAYAPIWEKSTDPTPPNTWLGGFFLIVGGFMLTLCGPMFGMRPAHSVDGAVHPHSASWPD